MSYRPVRFPLMALACSAALLTGCFTVEHKLPPKTYFGRLPNAPAASRQHFDHSEMKNWFLAGLGPYSDFGTADLLAPHAKDGRIENLAVETVFTDVDTLVWIFPGAVYGYYFWAPRHIHVSGDRVR
jgi:hypothetical protein